MFLCHTWLIFFMIEFSVMKDLVIMPNQLGNFMSYYSSGGGYMDG